MKTFISFLFLSSIVASAETSIFKMYSAPNIHPNPYCDVHTQLVLTTNDGSGIAVLSDHVSGICEIHVEENKRVYNIVKTGQSCGSLFYAGGESYDDRIEITDHRARICKDIVPAKIIIKETNAARTEALFSNDR